MYIYIYIYIFTTEGRIFEVAIESWPEWDRPFRRSNRLSSQAMKSTRTESQFCTATSISSLCTVFTFHFDHCLRQSPHLLKRHLAQVITLVAE